MKELAAPDVLNRISFYLLEAPDYVRARDLIFANDSCSYRQD
jgi:hypothetical protein